MTDNEIIKALEYCAEQRECSECPVLKQCNKDVWFLEKQAYSLINRQKEEIEALIAGQETLQKALAEKVAEYEALKADEEREHQYCKNVCEPKYKAEIERLKVEIDLWKEECSSVGCENEWLKAYLKIAKAETTEQLSKKIESRLANNTDISNVQYQSIIFDISEACKEMVGDAE